MTFHERSRYIESGKGISPFVHLSKNCNIRSIQAHDSYEWHHTRPGFPTGVATQNTALQMTLGGHGDWRQQGSGVSIKKSMITMFILNRTKCPWLSCYDGKKWPFPKVKHLGTTAYAIEKRGDCRIDGLRHSCHVPPQRKHPWLQNLQRIYDQMAKLRW